MFNNEEKRERMEKLEREIDRLEAKQSELEPDSDQYAKIDKSLKIKIAERDKLKSFFSRIDPTALTVGIGGILIQGLAAYLFAKREDKGPITSTPAKNFFSSMFRNRRV